MQDSTIDRKDVLHHFWNTISQCVPERIPLSEVMDKSWLNPERNLHEVLKEVMSISIMHEKNLWSLKTEEAKKYYAANLDLPTALHIDLQKNKKRTEMEDKKEELYQRTFLVQCHKDKLVELGNWMYDNDIFFQKCTESINLIAASEVFPTKRIVDTEEAVTGDSKAINLNPAVIGETCKMLAAAMSVESFFRIKHVRELLNLSREVFERYKNKSYTANKNYERTDNLIKEIDSLTGK